MKWKFHHIALLVTSKLTSSSPLSQNVREFTECSFKLNSAEFSEDKMRILYFQCLFFNSVVEGSCGMISFEDIINLSVYCQEFFHLSFSRCLLSCQEQATYVFLYCKSHTIGPALQVTYEPVLEFIWIKGKCRGQEYNSNRWSGGSEFLA